MDNLPKKISPCPIVETVIEIRFSSILPSEAVFGVIYSKIASDFDKNIKKLPILQIPELVRSKDPNLTYQAHYSLSKAGTPLQLNIGPRTITFSNNNGYIGWDKYFAFVKEVLEKIKGTDVIHLPERVGIRYINFFDYQILDKINLNINLYDKPIAKESTNFRTEFVTDGYVSVLQVLNNVNANINGKQKMGSTIDIDCIYNFKQSESHKNDDFNEIIENGHKIEKRLFFNLLKSEFINTFNLEY